MQEGEGAGLRAAGPGSACAAFVTKSAKKWAALHTGCRAGVKEHSREQGLAARLQSDKAMEGGAHSRDSLQRGRGSWQWGGVEEGGAVLEIIAKVVLEVVHEMPAKVNSTQPPWVLEIWDGTPIHPRLMCSC